MKLTNKRRYTAKDYTIGTLSIDGVPFCDTLEPTDRGLKSSMTATEIKANKVPGKTAIPKGVYTVNMNTVSPRFKGNSWAKPYGGIVPRLQGVKGFDGVLIHPGNTAADTEGCIIVGSNTEVGKVTQSVKTYRCLMELLMDAHEKGEQITIEIS